MGRRRKLLVPDSREAMETLKAQVIADKSTPQTPRSAASVSNQGSVASVASRLGIPYQPSDNGNMTTRQAGKIGGQIGGTMVQRLIQLAEQNLATEREGPVPPRHSLARHRK
jgi:small acid-soluble spore protein D (minor alpha/beta-type SASP)